MRFLIIFLIISMVLISAQNAFALPAKMDCTSILDEWSRVNYSSGNFVHDVIPPVIIDGKNTSFFIKAEQSTKNGNHIQLEMKLLDRNDHIMENNKFFVELLQDDKIIHRDLFYTNSGTLVLDFDQNNSTKETTIDTEQANMGYFFSSSDHITVNSPILDGTYQLKVTAIGACDKMVFFFPQEVVPVFQGSFLASDGHVNGVTLLRDSNQGIFGPPVIEIPKLLSPLKQFESGVLVDEISCKEDLVLITKASNGSPACVTSHTRETLIQRGWTESQDSFASKILTELRSGSQPITAEQGEFIKKIALMDSTIQEFVKDKIWDFDCCSYLTSNSEPKNLDVVIAFFDYDNKKQLEAIMDLQEVRVVKTQIYDTVHRDELSNK